MILDSLRMSAASFTERTGWEAKPEGLCKGELCVPAPDARLDDTTLDVEAVAARLHMPIVHDEDHGVWALGPAVAGTGRVLDSAEAPDPELVDFDGNAFRLSSLHGRKVLLVAWASW